MTLGTHTHSHKHVNTLPETPACDIRWPLAEPEQSASDREVQIDAQVGQERASTRGLSRFLCPYMALNQVGKGGAGAVFLLSVEHVISKQEVLCIAAEEK